MWIVLNNLRFYSYHGVLPQESIAGGYYTVNLRLGISSNEALHKDDIDCTVNYAEVFEAVKAEMQIPSKLIERVCGRIISHLFASFPLIDCIELSVVKENPPMGAETSGCGVEVSISRSNWENECFVNEKEE